MGLAKSQYIRFQSKINRDLIERFEIEESIIGFNHWFKKLQEINLVINRNYKKENREYHLQIRNSKIK